MTSRNITLAFFSPSIHDDWVNRLVARASTHPYCHVELYFEHTNQCFSIEYNEKASLKIKTLGNPCYEIVTMSVTAKEYDDCYNFCKKACKAEITFDDHGMWKSYIGPHCCSTNSMHCNKTFCSKIICEALQSACIEELMYYNACAMTPSRLYDSIMNSKRRVCASVPYKREQMLKQKMICFQNRVYMKTIF